jgi:chaperonin GroEL
MELQKAKPDKNIFVIMPFVSSPTRNQVQLTNFFENNIKQPIEQSKLKHTYRVWRSGETFNITDEIIRDLFKADLVIADLSGINPNPNVMYELGVRLALSNKPVILIREKHPENKKVFDVDGYFIYPYDPLSYAELERHVLAKLGRFETGEEVFESPVKKVLHNEITLSQSALSDLTVSQQKEIVLNGAKLVATNIISAYGPIGQGIPIKNDQGQNILAKQGLEIAEATWSSNPLENRGIEILAQVGKNMISRVGDGSKTGILLAYGIMLAGNEALKKGLLAQNVVSGIWKGIQTTKGILTNLAKPLQNKSEVAQIAATASKSEEFGALITDCFEKTGKDGIVSLHESPKEDITVEIIEGLYVTKGYLSKEFISDSGTNEWVRDSVFIMLYPNSLADFHEIIPLLEKIASAKKPLLILAESAKDTALSTLIVNSKSKTVECIVVEMRGLAENYNDLFEDIAILTGGIVIRSDLGMNLSSIQLNQLGIANRVIVTNDSFHIVGGRGNFAGINAYVKLLREKLNSAKDIIDQNRIQLRLARIAGATASINIGGATPQEKAERFYNLGSALNAARLAIEGGAVIGGGIALYNALKSVSETEVQNDEEKLGVEAVMSSLILPIKSLMNTANISVDDAFTILSDRKDLEIGFNAKTNKLSNLRNDKILDAAIMLKEALDIGYSYAKMFLESSSWMEKKSESIEN